MNDCWDIQQDLSEFIDGELPAERLAEITAHVGQCPLCAERLGELRKLAAGIAALPAAPVPPQFLADVRTKLRQPRATWVERLFRPIWWKVPLEAMAVVVVVAGIVALTESKPRPVVASRGVSAKILSGERMITASDLALEVGIPSASNPVPAFPVASSQPTPSFEGNPVIVKISPAQWQPAPSNLLERVVVTGDSLVAVKLRAETLARDYSGRVAPATQTNAFMVFLPQSKASTFRKRLVGAKAKVSYAVPTPVAPEPEVGVEVVVEP